MRYFDTSVVFSLYLNDAHTAHADAELRNNPADVILSRWVDVELKSAIGLSVRRRNLTLSTAERAFNRYGLDRAQGKYLPEASEDKHFAAAEEALAFNDTLRAGDALHLALALVERHMLVSADENLAKASRAHGIATVLIP